MKKKYLIILSISLGLYGNENTLYVLYTNNANGALENCYCPDHPYGAIEKRAVFVKQFMQEHSNTLLVDAGDFFPVSHRPYLDELILDAYSYLPYDAVLVGDQELSRKDKTMFSRTIKYPVLCANLNGKEAYGFKKNVIIEKNGYSIGIIGVINPNVFRYYPNEIKDSLQFTDTEETIRDFMNTHADSLDLMIALTHQGHDMDIQLANSVAGLDVIVGSHSQTKLDHGDRVNDCLIVQAGKEGYYVGVIEIKFNSDKEIISSETHLETMKLEMEDDLYIMNLIHKLENETGHVNRNKLKLKGLK